VTGSLAGILLGVLVGIRHAFEPDHLTAVSTLVTEAVNGRRGAALGALWGLGHTLSLVIVGVLLLAIGASLPARVAALFECGVSVMLIVLGVRAVVRAVRGDAVAPAAPHRHGPLEHAHGTPAARLRVAGRVVAWRPLLVGLVHGLAGSGALTALVFAQLPTTALRLLYITLFGLGSVAGMAIASGIAGASLRTVARSHRTRRRLALITGAVSIVAGALWAIPMLGVLLA
jgi:mannose/fructose/N-acetylgalactosamine-specific phosphotransferase system component IID